VLLQFLGAEIGYGFAATPERGIQRAVGVVARQREVHRAVDTGLLTGGLWVRVVPEESHSFNVGKTRCNQ